MEEEVFEIRDAWIKIREYIAAGDGSGIIAWMDTLPSGEIGRILSRLSEDELTTVMQLIGPEEGAELLNQIPEAQAVDILEDLPSEAAAAIVDELDSDEQADLLGELDKDDAEAILSELDPEDASDIRRLIEYDWSTAGGVMVTEYLYFRETATTSQVLERLRANKEVYADYEVQYIYIVSRDGLLKGVLKLRDLLLSRDQQRVGDLMRTDILKVKTDAPLGELREIFEEYNYIGIPVVDDSDKLVGVVRRAAVEEAVGELATEDFLKMSGLNGEEELRTMPVFLRSRRRLSWLAVSMALNVVSASVIAVYEHILQDVIVLAMVLPIIANMSGASGNQAIAVSLRELTLGLIKPFEVMRVLLQEVWVGLFNGLILGLVLGLILGFWKGNPYLGLVVGAAMLFNSVLSVCVGGAIPMLLKWVKLDPALASGPLLTTVSDACGFFMTLAFASLMLPHIL